jgi:hypothetical protein
MRAVVPPSPLIRLIIHIVGLKGYVGGSSQSINHLQKFPG